MRLGLTNSVQEQMFENRFWAVTFYLDPLDLFCQLKVQMSEQN